MAVLIQVGGHSPALGILGHLVHTSTLTEPCPPSGSYRATRSVYSSYTVTVNAAFEWLSLTRAQDRGLGKRIGSRSLPLAMG